MKELLKKIQLVSDKCKAIEKDMVVGKGQNSYKAVSDHSVILKVKEAEKEAGIISIPIKQELIDSNVIRFNKKSYNSNEIEEKINYVDNIKMTLRVYDIESEKFIDIESYGKGIDPADKGFGKASTYARKYALLNAYKIATGEDPDKEPSEDQDKELKRIKKQESPGALIAKGNKEIEDCKTLDELAGVWTKYKAIQSYENFKLKKDNKKKELSK